MAFGDEMMLQAQFSSRTLDVVLRSSDDFSQGDELYAVVTRTKHPNGERPATNPPYEWAESDVSDNPIPMPAFDQSCYPFTIELTKDGAEVQPNECVYIDGSAQLPSLVGRIESGVVEGFAEWSLQISYSRSCRTYDDTYEAVLGAAEQWHVNSTLQDELRGGRAVLRCRDQLHPEYQAEFGFWIPGLNPAPYDARSYINSKASSMWYDTLVTKQEGGLQESRWYLQFNEKDVTDPCGDVNDIRHTPNWDGACDPAHPGFGMYQLTWFTVGGTTREANAQELWDWKENVDIGTTLLRQHQTDAIVITDVHRVAAGVMIGSLIIEDMPFGDDGIVLSDTLPKIAEHGVALKKYNGLGIGGHDLIEFDLFELEWVEYRSSDYIDQNGNRRTNYYVDDVCSRLVN